MTLAARSRGHDLRGTPAPSRARLLLAEAALRLSRWLIAIAERCRRWPSVVLVMMFVYKHVAAFARRILRHGKIR
jgi:hypothetical protein